MSLYNKFRPLGWDSVIGQDGIVETLKNAVSSDRVVSTYLFCGPRGTGKTTCARILAKALNCEKPVAPGIPCCECDTCKDIASDQTSFVTEIDSACFHRDVRVKLSNGKTLRIGEIVDKKLDVEVLSYNIEKKCIEPKKVVGWYNNGSYNEFYNVVLESGYGEKRCISGVTLNHKIYNKERIKQPLSAFKVGDEVLYYCPTINDIQKSILVGTLLGDSSFKGGYKYVNSMTNLNVMLECSHNEAQWEYLEYKNKLFANIGAKMKHKVVISGHGGKFKRFITKTNEYLSSLKDEWYEDGKITDAMINSINEISLAFWYMDDGTFSDPKKKSALRLCTNGYTENEVDRLVEYLNSKWQFGAKKANVKENEFVINIGREGGKRFFSLIKNFVHPVMMYKMPLEFRDNFSSLENECENRESLIPVKIKEIKRFYRGTKKESRFIRYDIEVEGNHNYFVGRGVLVSNSNTGIDNMRDIKQSANLSGGGKWKVYILDECHMLSKAAQNAALKMFEESPEKVIFVLCTTELNKVEGTIISRSLRFDFRPITIDNIIHRLRYICGEEKIQVDDAALKMIAKAANGGMRDSISILERVSLENNNIINIDNVVRSLGVAPLEIVARLGEVLNGNNKAAFEIVSNIIDNGYDIYQFLQSSVDYLRDVLLLKIGLNSLVIADSETMASMEATAANISDARISESIKILEETMGKYKYTDNKRILVEISFFKMASVTIGNNNVAPVAPQITNNVVEQVNPSMVEQMVRNILNSIDFSRYMPVAPAYQNAPMPVEQPQVQMPQIVQNIPVQQVQVGQQMYNNLTYDQWQKYLEILEVFTKEDITPHSILVNYCRPVGWDLSTFVVEISKDYEFYAEIMNEQYATLCARVLGSERCMNASVFFKVKTVDNNNTGHSQQGAIGGEIVKEEVNVSAPVIEDIVVSQEPNAFMNVLKEQDNDISHNAYSNHGVTQSNSTGPVEMGSQNNISQATIPSLSPPWEPPFVGTQDILGSQSAPPNEIYNNSSNLSNSNVGNYEVVQIKNTDPNAVVNVDMLHGIFGFGRVTNTKQ